MDDDCKRRNLLHRAGGRSRRIRRVGLAALYLGGFLSPGWAQTTYYVASTGRDTHAGRSVGQALQTLDRVNSLVLQPGDSVLFRRGDTFRGSLRVRQSGLADQPLVFDAYGSGSKPVLAGSVPLGNWTNQGNNTWQAACPACGNRVTGLYRNGAALPLGRYPNADTPNRGFLTMQSHSGKTSLTSQQSLPSDYTGAEAVIRITQWIINRATITGQSGNTIRLASSSNYDLLDGWGFFIQNHPATLDQPGEWCYDPATQLVRVYDPTGTLNTQTITATAFEIGVELAGVSFVTLRNFHLTEARGVGLLAESASSLVIANNDLSNAGEDGMLFRGSGASIRVENNRLSRINNNGVWVDDYQDVVFSNNTVRCVGVVPGRGKSGDGQYIGLQFNSRSNTLIENNRIDSIGYNGIGFASSTIIRRNVISHFCLCKTDGGGIYAWNGHRLPIRDVRIEANLIFGGVAAPEGTVRGDGYTGVNGIFLDECLHNVEVTNNSIFDNQGRGIFLHGDNRITLTGNTCFNNTDIQFALKHNAGYCQVSENVLRGNIFVSKWPSQWVANIDSDRDDLPQYGTFDENFYVRPFEDAFKLKIVFDLVVLNAMTLAQWQARTGHDRHSANSPLTYPPFRVNSLSKNVFTDGSAGHSEPDWSVWSPHDNGRATWDNPGQGLRVSFPKLTGADNSHVLVSKEIGAVSKGQSFLLRFDAVATAEKRIDVFIRQRGIPYQDLSQRFALLVGPTATTYNVAFTATADEADAFLTYQVQEDNQSVWLDNIRLEEARITPVNPDEYLQLVYNPSGKDSLVALDGQYLDVRNRRYNRQVLVAPFASVVLLKDRPVLAKEDIVLQTPPATQERPTVYPNPSATRFSFRADRDVQSIRVIDGSGRELLLLGALSRNQTMEFGEPLAAGSYFLRIHYRDDESRAIKLVKLPR